MLREPDLLDAVRAWASERTANLRGHAIKLEISESPEDRDPRSIKLAFEAARKLSEIIIWANGNAELLFADIDSWDIIPEHRDIRSTQDLEDALNATMEWVEDPT